MKCEEFELTASAYIDRQLSQSEASEYRVHLSFCSSCRAHLAELEELSLLFRNVEKPEVPVELRGYVMADAERRARGEMTLGHKAVEWLQKMNPQFVSYAAGAVVSAILFIFLLSGFKPIPVIAGGSNEYIAIVPAVIGSDPEYHAYNNLPRDSATASSDHYYQLPRVLNNSALVSFSHIAYQRPGNEGLVALVEIEPDGCGKLVEIVEEPNDPYLVEQLWWSLSKRTFQPAIVEGRAVSTRIVLLVEKMDVRG